MELLCTVLSTKETSVGKLCYLSCYFVELPPFETFAEFGVCCPLEKQSAHVLPSQLLCTLKFKK